MAELVRIWCVAPQRLCNFHCSYCVSTGDWAKDNRVDWRSEDDRSGFARTVRWIGTRPFQVGVRLATLGEPFTSREFLTQAAWLTQQDGVRFVELVTNGSLLKSRLPKLAGQVDLSKLSLWVTHHHTQISIQRLIDNALFAQERYGCFVVVNGLLFANTVDQVAKLRVAAGRAGLRFNVDLGYETDVEAGTYTWADQVVPISHMPGWRDQALRLGADPTMLTANMIGLDDVRGRPCAAGHDYLFIGIDGEVYPCSRYYELEHGRLGNVLDPDFELRLRPGRWAGCHAICGCSNKEDFLNLDVVDADRRAAVPSLGWLGT
jgi:MoaA/NifB/PqqE/SkfB family radical SAM enzyme